MKSGIYCYKDLQNNNEIVYIGKDSNIHYNKRHKDHLHPSNYNKQPFNKILQKNSNRYQYHILKSWDKTKYNPKLTSILEILYIKRYKPKFNFTTGGEDLFIAKISEKTKEKISKSKTGTKLSKETRKKMSENNAKYWKGKHLSETTKKKISEFNKTRIGELNGFYGKKHSDKTKEKMRNAKKKAQNTTGYYRVTKKKDLTCKQGFIWVYQYYDENGKHKRLSSVNIDKLKEKVIKKGLEWLKYNKNEVIV